MNATKLNAIQLHLIRMFARQTNEKDLVAIKNMLSAYYAQRVDEESDKLWEEKGLTEEAMNELLNSHTRTTYE